MKADRYTVILASVIVAGVAVNSCGTHKKLSYLEEQTVGVGLTLANEVEEDLPELDFGLRQRDTIKLEDFEGREVLIMKAVRDDETGEMVAADVLDAAVVTARFRNVAERNGKVDLAFKVTVPKSMQDSKWQLRFYPDMFILGDSTRLDPVVITGAGYRKTQLKGYQQYQKFIDSIITDSTTFINMKQLELFLSRNIPALYAFKNDSTEVSDDQFYSNYGVSEQYAVYHYTNKLSKNRNERKKARTGRMLARFVKAPIVTEGIRLDTIIVSGEGDFEYNYVQTINTRPKLRKADVVLSGAIFDQDKQIYSVPRSEPLTFYISSVSSFAENKERYLTKVIERKVEANTESRIDFEVNKSDIKPNLGNNQTEIAMIKRNLQDLLDSDKYDLDSIVIRATASPEGKYNANRSLAQKRSESVSKYFESFIKHYRDSLKREEGIVYNLDDEYVATPAAPVEIKFLPRCIPENWDDLGEYVRADTIMTDGQKESYFNLLEIKDFDAREAALVKMPYYAHLKNDVYPDLRTVKFNFFLHRKGVVKDTVHTTVLDTNYMLGVQALKDMDYELAIEHLADYQDFNTAVAYVALDRNTSAMNILDKMERTAEVNYLLALIYARSGHIQEAVQAYVTSCQQNHMFVYRGNLDPEISKLISDYNLTEIIDPQEEDDLLLDF